MEWRTIKKLTIALGEDLTLNNVKLQKLFLRFKAVKWQYSIF
jgi:hypothetical protein